MDLKPFYAKQKELDQAILDKHDLLDSSLLVDDKITAFKVELGELANEIRFFKYWSQKPPSPKQVILEEWVDCFHFLLSIGNYRKYDRFVHEIEIPNTGDAEFKIMFQVLFRNQLDCTAAFKQAMYFLFAVAGKLGFTEEDITNMYELKNQKNHNRQAEGY